MYSYRLVDDKPVETYIGDTVPVGFIVFNGGEPVDWGKYKLEKGELLEIPAPPPQPEPEPHVPTTEEKLMMLDGEYQWQFDQLKLAWAAANLDSNTALAEEIKADYTSLKAKYQAKREALLHG